MLSIRVVMHYWRARQAQVVLRILTDDKHFVSHPHQKNNAIRIDFSMLQKLASLTTLDLTGKTAALLCGSLAWLYHKRDTLTSGSRSTQPKPKLQPVKKCAASSSKQKTVVAVEDVAVDETGLEVLQTKTAEEVGKFATLRCKILFTI